MPQHREEVGNLWLARALWEVGAVRFGDFTIGRSTVHSPVFVNTRRLISRPRVLKRAARVIAQTIAAEQARLHPRIKPFQLVAGVPNGGLHIATAFSLYTNTPMICLVARKDDPRGNYTIEGRFEPGQTVLLIDDLVTTGGSIMEMGDALRQDGLDVTDAMVLVDRGEGAVARLRHHGYTLTSILQVEIMLNNYLSTRRIDANIHKKSCDYIQRRRKEVEDA